MPYANKGVQTQNAPVWGALSSMLPVADWTAEAMFGETEPADDHDPIRMETKDVCYSPLIVDDRCDVFQQLARVLFRSEQHHLLLTGPRGVGKTSTVRELSRRAATGEIAFLRNCRFLWIDVSNVGPEDSRACLESIGSVASMALEELLSARFVNHLEGDEVRWKSEIEIDDTAPNEVIVCLDHIDNLLKRPNGGTNKPLLRSIASRLGIRLIGILSNWAYNELIASDAQMLDLFARIEVPEPSDDVALAILKQKAHSFEAEYGFSVPDSTLDRIISLSSNYLLNEHHPAKGIRILRRICDDKRFDITQTECEQPKISNRDPIRVISEMTRIPEATLEGDTGDADFEQILSEAVLGQERAVKAVATELRLIKSGLSEPGKPAGVLLFAGMTGVGKTELAKRIAELYSTSKRLQTYSMGNFTEPHSVSGIIGVPPGYVGYEEGGRLINELNADPYSVYLLDEAEKCHPNVWKPFLNLFDEGWIVDQRGRKAYADRAVFILTTNAGDKVISQMTQQGKPEIEIIDRVKTTLSRIRQERSSQPVFTPQFLARLKRIVVFGPLDESAMIGIAQKILRQVAKRWMQKRGKTLIVSDELVNSIGHRAHGLNEKAKGEEGGRIIGKLISDEIEHNIQVQATERRTEYMACHTIRCEIATNDQPSSNDNRTVIVTFESSNS